jgi:hypothetical protein
MKHVTREVTVPFPPDRAVAELTASLSRMKCRLELQTGNSLTFSRRYSPAFFIVLYVILFPIGLLLILARPKHATSMNCQEVSGGTWFGVSTDDPVVSRFFDEIAQRQTEAKAAPHSRTPAAPSASSRPEGED